MSKWGKFGAVLYCSTTLAAATTVGFALSIGTKAFPSNIINFLDKNYDVRNWVFIAAAVSLAYITLSAFTMFCVLTKTKKPISDSNDKITKEADLTISQKKNEIADSDNPLLLLQHRTNQSVKSTIDSQKLEGNGINYSNLQDTERNIDQMNKGYNNTGISHTQNSDYLRSNYFDCTLSSQLQVDNLSIDLIGNAYEEFRRETDKEQNWKEMMKTPKHLVPGVNCYIKD